MNVCHNKPVIIAGYSVYDINGGQFRAVNADRVILFTAEGQNGGLYFNVNSYTCKTTGRCYHAQRYLYKYIPLVRAFAFYLADNNYLWDYKEQKPLTETRLAAMLKCDRVRAKGGRPLIYPEYTAAIIEKEGSAQC